MYDTVRLYGLETEVTFFSYPELFVINTHMVWRDYEGEEKNTQGKALYLLLRIFVHFLHTK